MELTKPLAKRLDEVIAYIIDNSTKANYRHPHLWTGVNLQKIIDHYGWDVSKEDLHFQLLNALEHTNRNAKPVMFDGHNIIKRTLQKHFILTEDFLK